MLVVSEAELILQLQSKSSIAFRYLYDAYAPTLYASIQKLIPCTESAQDVLQNVMAKIWSNIDKYDASRGRLFTWMINITRNETMDYFRTKEYRVATLTTTDPEEHIPVVSCWEKVINQMDLRKLTGQLPLKERAVLELIGSGFTCKEVAQLLHLPEGTVKTRMRTSYRKLRLALQN